MDQLHIKKYSLKELRHLIASKWLDHFAKAPITLCRIASYFENHRAQKEDIVMYLLFEKDKLLAYHTLLSDKIYMQGQAIQITWFIGNYVFPKYRRKGYSTILLKEVRKDWNKHLLFPNYAHAFKYVLNRQDAFRSFGT